MNREHALYKEAIEGLLPDQEAIRKNVLAGAKKYDAQAPEERKEKHRWLIPLAACIAALAVICTAVPPVRAAIGQWFADVFTVQDYMAQPTDARPAVSDIDSIIEQTIPENPVAANRIEIINVAPEWQEWAASLKPSVGDVFFDGKQLIVSLDMGGGAMEFWIGDTEAYPFFISLGNPGYIKLNGEKYAYSVSADTVRTDSYEKYISYIMDGGVTGEDKRIIEQEDSVPFAATIDFSRPVEITEGFEGWSEENKALFLDDMNKVQKYDPEYTPFEFKTPAPGEKLKGLQEVEANMPLILTDYSKQGKTVNDGVVYEGEVIGLVKLKFSFDPEAGNKNMKTYQINQTAEFSGEGRYAWTDQNSDPEYETFVNKTVDMSGVSMTAKRMEVNASGAELYVSMTCPDGWDELDKNNFLGSLLPRVKADGADAPESGIQFGLEEQGEDIGMRIHLDMLPSEIAAVDTFEILPLLSYFTGYDDVPYVEGEPTRIKKDDIKGWQEETKELTDCALKFSLK